MDYYCCIEEAVVRYVDARENHDASHLSLTTGFLDSPVDRRRLWIRRVDKPYKPWNSDAQAESRGISTKVGDGDVFSSALDVLQAQM